MSRQAIFGKCMLLVVMTILFTQITYAIGIGPGRTTIDFASELEKEIAFTIYNNEQKEMKALITIEGELAEYVSVNKLLVDFKADEAKKDMAYKVKLPKEFEKPGEHTASIIVTELPSELEAEGTYIGATTAVVTQLLVKVPYPGKYAEARLDISEASSGETVNFIVPVYNGGDEKILRASAIIEILGSTNKVIATIKSNEISIEPKERKEVVAGWKADAEAGTYHAVATVTYDGKVTKAENNFAIGSLQVNLKDVNVKNFNLGGVAKFNILVENKWNENIKDLYAQLIITNAAGDVLADVKSATVEIASQQEVVLNTFWDTEGVETGNYNAKVILHFAGKSTEKLMNTEVTINDIKTSFAGGPTAQVIGVSDAGMKQSSIFMLAILALIVINIGWFVYFKKIRRKNP